MKTYLSLLLLFCIACSKDSPTPPEELLDESLVGKTFHYLLFEDKAACDKVNEQVLFFNCSQWMTFTDESTGFLVLTDIGNEFTYTQSQDTLKIDVNGPEVLFSFDLLRSKTSPERLTEIATDSLGNQRQWKEVPDWESIWD